MSDKGHFSIVETEATIGGQMYTKLSSKNPLARNLPCKIINQSRVWVLHAARPFITAQEIQEKLPNLPPVINRGRRRRNKTQLCRLKSLLIAVDLWTVYWCVVVETDKVITFQVLNKRITPSEHGFSLSLQQAPTLSSKVHDRVSGLLRSNSAHSEKWHWLIDWCLI